jgi:hypothetical protein
MRPGFGTPLVLTAGSAVAAYCIALGLHAAAGGAVEMSLRAALVCVAGGLYTNLFEHAWHRYAMHSRRPDPRHAVHHRLFYGARFQNSDPAARGEIVTGWYVFPVLLALHYTAFVLLFGAALAPAFFLGVTLHFAIYEVTHWYTHIEGNRFDRCVSRIPVVRQLRAAQIHHHKLHHADPRINFNFNPPYAGDRLGGLFQR